MLRAIAIAIATAALAAAVAPGVARGASWRWPVRGRVAGAFLLSPGDPYAAGQRRGIAVAATPGATVRSTCPGRVAFAGEVGRAGPTISIVCGGLRATYEGLGAVSVHRGEPAVVGEPIAVLGAAGVLRLGARVEGRARPRRYVDPLALLHAEPPAVGPRGPAPRARPPGRRPPAARWRVGEPADTPVAPQAAAGPAPLGAWIGLGLLGAALPVGSLWHVRLARRHRRRSPDEQGARAPAGA